MKLPCPAKQENHYRNSSGTYQEYSLEHNFLYLGSNLRTIEPSSGVAEKEMQNFVQHDLAKNFNATSQDIKNKLIGPKPSKTAGSFSSSCFSRQEEIDDR